MAATNPEEYAERLARLDADPEYDRALEGHRERRIAARRDGTPEPPSFRREGGEIVYSKTTTTEVRLRAAQRAAQAAEMKVQRYSWATIAQVLGYKNASVARKSVERYINRLPLEPMELLRRHELNGLDAAEAALADRIAEGDPQAIDAMVKIKHQRARLMGLYPKGAGASGVSVELTITQVTTQAVRITKTYPDMPIEQVINEIMTNHAPS